MPPGWPSLFWPPLDDRYVLYRLYDMWRFILFWTLVMYASFHWAAVGIALFVQIGKKRTNWKYLWTVPITYSVIAGFEALVAGSVTGAMSVGSLQRIICLVDPRLTKTVWKQSWCDLHFGRLVHDYMDTVHLGLGQRLCAGRLVILYLGRPMSSTGACCSTRRPCESLPRREPRHHPPRRLDRFRPRPQSS